MIYIAKNASDDNKVSLLTISKNLNISKIYLEQAFVLLKKENLVYSTKGPKGGYTLARNASNISVYEILLALDATIFEKTDTTITGQEKTIETIMQNNIFSIIDENMKKTLEIITLENLLDALSKEENQGYMYYL